MRIGVEINGVLRNTIGKIEQTYEKFLLSKTDGIDGDTDFKYEMDLPVTSLNLQDHFKFKEPEDLFSFLYEEFPMEVFGHSQSTEYTTFNDLNEVYINLRDNHDFIIVSDEIGRSKPSSLFFLSKFGCQLERVFFYSNYTINSMWDGIDVLLTSNPALLLEYPSDKIVIKFETEYNKHINHPNTIVTIKELEEELKKFL